MTAVINDAQLKLIVSDAGAKPDVFINPVGHIICHLTQGFNSGPFPAGQQNALTAAAHVPLGGGPSGTTFGFVQIGRINVFGAFYAGRIPSEGSIGVQAHVPPALPTPVLLDAFGNPPLPWFIDPSNSSFVPPQIHASWGDHPASKVPLKLRNSATSNVDNFLFHFIDDRDFWTIFTAQDPGGALRYIAHFHWRVLYDVKLMWRNGQPQKRVSNSLFEMKQRNVKGRPPDADLQSMLNTPAGPRANIAFGAALTQAFFGARGANRGENPRRFAAVPLDFWG